MGRFATFGSFTCKSTPSRFALFTLTSALGLPTSGVTPSPFAKYVLRIQK